MVFALVIGSCLIWGASCPTSKGSRMPGLPDHMWACLEWHCRIVVNGWHFRPRALLGRNLLPSLGLFGTARCTCNLVLIRLAGKALLSPWGRDWENGTKLIARVCWNCLQQPSATWNLQRLDLLTLFNPRISVQLRFAEDRFTVALFYAASKRHCILEKTR